MNKDRRKQLADIRANIQSICEQVQDLCDSFNFAKDDINEVLDEEQEAYDSLPESLQYSAKGDDMNEAISNMEAIIGQLDFICEDLHSAMVDNVPEMEGYFNLLLK